MFPLSEAITKKVLRYEAGYDDRGLDIAKFAYSVGTSHVCVVHTLRLCWRVTSHRTSWETPKGRYD
jgi:hypothetical protein